MDVIVDPHRMHAWSVRRKGRGGRVALVPTMGFLHQGHLSLMEWGRRAAEHLVTSIFVNPIQFGPNEDFAAYPRDLERDLELCRGAGVDCVFTPRAEAMYPPGNQTRVSVSELAAPLCGAGRPGHFDGVTTVVAKLFGIVACDVAVFGQKDFQQWLVIRRMAEDLNLPVEVVGRPTVREPDGLAMSSRNKYLDAGQRQTALGLNQALDLAEKMIKAGEQDAAAVERAVIKHIEANGGAAVEYAELRDPESLAKTGLVAGPVLLALAVNVGRARLIDNRVIGRT
jgi:pantoate--beta-alanine ligase